MKIDFTPENRKKLIRSFLLTFGGLCAIGLVGAGLGYWYISKDLPNIISLEDYKPSLVTQISVENDDGEGEQIIGEFFKERRYLVSYDQIPQIVINAFISAEDEKFFEHQGVSPMAILRAGIANFRAGHVVQGGSTITQQVAKSLFLSPEKRLIRKIREAILAYRIERNLSKEQVLYLYLNQIYLGQGAYGIGAAAKSYFRKTVDQLTLPEAALLAGMPQAPSRISPHRNPELAKDRQRYVLRRMLESRYITQEQMLSAIADPLQVFDSAEHVQKESQYLVENVRRYLIDRYGEKAVYEGGLRVLVPSSLQNFKVAKNALREGIRATDKRIGFRGPAAEIDLENQEEVTKYIEEQRERLLADRFDYMMFMPDGKLIHPDLVDELGEPIPIVEEGKIYRAIVTKVDNRSKKAIVNIAGYEFDMPLENMKWARNPAPKYPTQILKKSQIVLAKIERRPPPKKRKKKPLEEEKIVLEAHLEQDPEVQGALFAIDANNGFVLALEGGFSYEKSEFNRANQAYRQPGSAFKPIIYSAAVEAGYTPATIIQDAPIVYKDEEIGKWKPSNFSERFYGDTTFYQAFIKSRNIPTIKLVQWMKVNSLIDYARRLGMVGQFSNDLSISLGSGATNLVEITSVYSIFPRYGRKVSPVFIQKIVDRDGRVLEENIEDRKIEPVVIHAKEPVEGDIDSESKVRKVAVKKNEGEQTLFMPVYPREEDPEQVIDPRVASVMTHLMKEVVNSGTGRRAKVLERPAAGKTGTTNDYKDAWFIGFTANVVTGVWVGFDDQRSLGPGETGSKAALPIWLSFMQQATEAYPVTEFPIPEGIRIITMDPKGGKRLDDASPTGVELAFFSETEPTKRSISNVSDVETESEFFKEDFQ